MITLGNFFSGAGTWELAAKLCGATPIWESEIEPFPVALGAKRFPECKQLGDITKISGYDIEPCDIMTNSSPCQDLSVAGKRSGLRKKCHNSLTCAFETSANSPLERCPLCGSYLDLTRSGLFFEVIRITKEMREHELEQLRRMRRTDESFRLIPRPYVWCWENVCGALSSRSGKDFHKAIEEIARIVTPDVYIPLPKDGKWANAGSVDGDGFSIAWCVRNAANEGVPQRRRRVFLVADFTGLIGARKILFEREGMSWNFAEIRETWEETSRSLEERIASAREYIRSGAGESSDGRTVDQKNG